jgi:hypothetical protein
MRCRDKSEDLAFGSFIDMPVQIEACLDRQFAAAKSVR